MLQPLMTLMQPFVALIFVPVIVLCLAIFITSRISKHKLAVHILTFVVLLLTMPLYLLVVGIVEPTTIEIPGQTDRNTLLVYSFFTAPALIAYAIHIWTMRERP